MSAAHAYPENFLADQIACGTHHTSVGGDSNSKQAMPPATPTHGSPAWTQLPADHEAVDAHAVNVGGDLSSDGQAQHATQLPLVVAVTSPDPTTGDSTPQAVASGPGTL